MKKPKKWTEVYPQGTKEGDEEAKFFRALARNPKFTYRSIAQLVKETGLTRERVEEIIDKYHTKANPPLVYPHATNPDMWGYWERCPEAMKKDDRSISEKDQDGRIDKHITGTSQCDTSDCGDQCSCGTPAPTVTIVGLPLNQSPVYTTCVYACTSTASNVWCVTGDNVYYYTTA